MERDEETKTLKEEGHTERTAQGIELKRSPHSEIADHDIAYRYATAI